jgi:hypothetical protein
LQFPSLKQRATSGWSPSLPATTPNHCQSGGKVAVSLAFTLTLATLIATAICELVRNMRTVR